MSGAAEGIAGLGLSAVSVTALFTTCIECFDIIVAGKNFSEDYEQLCALVRSTSNARLGLTGLVAVLFAAGSITSLGESVGLVPNPMDAVCDTTRTSIDPISDRKWSGSLIISRLFSMKLARWTIDMC
jgi:hypothetical protein